VKSRAEDISAFLERYRRMSLEPSTEGSTIFVGLLDFIASPPGGTVVDDTYEVRIELLPNKLLKVWETGGRITRDPNHHVYPDGSLCLGSHLRLSLLLSEAGTSVVGIVERCLIPFLYAASLREGGQPGFAFGELAHGKPGLLQDYETIVGLQGREAVEKALHLLSRRRRVANKRPCPCGCGKRLGRCPVHHSLNKLRQVMPRSHFAARRSDLK
jgi:hypothetical protein